MKNNGNISMGHRGTFTMELTENIESEFVGAIKNHVGLEVEFMQAEITRSNGIAKYTLTVADPDKQKMIVEIIIGIMKIYNPTTNN